MKRKKWIKGRNSMCLFIYSAYKKYIICTIPNAFNTRFLFIHSNYRFLGTISLKPATEDASPITLGIETPWEHSLVYCSRRFGKSFLSVWKQKKSNHPVFNDVGKKRKIKSRPEGPSGFFTFIFIYEESIMQSY